MGLFNKNKKNNITPTVTSIPKVCNHRWKDFNWYPTISTKNIKNSPNYSANVEITFIEPYVCIYCKARKDIVLNKSNYQDLRPSDIKNLIERAFIKYPKLKPQSEVEDEVNDFILVDREYLDIYESITKVSDAPKLCLKK